MSIPFVLCFLFTIVASDLILPPARILGGHTISYPRYSTHAPISTTSTIGAHNPHFTTVTSTITKTHLIRVTTTSDIWVTSATIVPRTVTQYTTLRKYVPDVADTVTSVIKITRTPVDIETSVVDTLKVKTVVSGFTNFVTATETIDYWHPITHYATSFEVVSIPIFETQTLLQVISSTVTVRDTTTVTKTRHYYSHWD